MKKNKQPDILLEGERLCLRPVVPDDANEAYCRWMNDPAVNQYLESRFSTHTLETLREYVEGRLGDADSPFFAIVLKEGDRHIGNIKLGPIDRTHRFADVGIIIGEQDCWGKGYAAEAIGLIVKYAFETLDLHKLTAGFYAPHVQSMQAFLKAGFVQEGVRKSHCYCDGRYVDDILVGLVRPEP
ncbi:GNAT family N-acetyltransferase [Thermodesulfobacteriota bacterium]